jgi:hypothetical protein
MKKIVMLALLLLAGCNSPRESGVKVIVGARLIAAPGQPPIEHSVVVVEGTKFREVGPQSSTPVPKGAEMTGGIGMTIESLPGSGPIEAGRPANLVLKGSAERVMKNGEWAK